METTMTTQEQFIPTIPLIDIYNDEGSDFGTSNSEYDDEEDEEEENENGDEEQEEEENGDNEEQEEEEENGEENEEENGDDEEEEEEEENGEENGEENEEEEEQEEQEQEEDPEDEALFRMNRDLADEEEFVNYMFYPNCNVFDEIQQKERIRKRILRELRKGRLDKAFLNIFFEACADGKLQIVQWATQMGSIDVSAKRERGFRLAAWNGHLNILWWLLNHKPDLDVSAENEQAFRFACHRGHLPVAKLLLHHKPTIRVSMYDDEAFRAACTGGWLDVAQWLLHKKPDIDLVAQRYEAFRFACANGHIEVAEWLLTLLGRENVPLHYANDAFVGACYYGHFNTASLLISLPIGGLNVGEAFYYAGQQNRLELMTWLHSECGPILDIWMDKTFNIACAKNKITCAMWFANVLGKRYFVTLNDTASRIVHSGFQVAYLARGTVSREREECPICFDKQTELVTPCEHAFCSTCIQMHMRRSDACPCCRGHVRSLLRIVDNTTTMDNGL